MAIKASRIDVWAAKIDDRSGATADALEALARAGANLEMVFARRTPEQPGSGVVFLAPIKGAKAIKAAAAAGFARQGGLHGVKVEGGDKPGIGASIGRALGDAEASFRGMTAIAIGGKFMCFLAFDSAEEASRAIAALKKLQRTR